MFILAEIGKFSPEEYEQYQKSLKIMSDYYNIIDTAVEEAEKRGELSRALRMARAMLANGESIDTISKYTELSVEEIEAVCL